MFDVTLLNFQPFCHIEAKEVPLHFAILDLNYIQTGR